MGAVVLALGAGAGLLARGADPATPATSTAPAPVMLDRNTPIAVIDGIPIDNQKFYDLMMQAFGMRVFLQSYDLVLVEHAMQLAGVPFQGEAWNTTVNKELDGTLDSMPDPKDGKPFDKEAKLRVLAAALDKQGLTWPEFQIRLQTKAGLRALAAGKNEVTPTEAKSAWQAEFGPRRTVHLIPVTGPDQAAQVRKEIVDQGKTPEEAAKDLSIPNMAEFVISENATNIDDVRNVTFHTLKKEKELSAEVELPAQAGQKPQKVLIYLDKIEGDRTKENPYDEKKMIDQVHAVKEEQWMQQQLQILRSDRSAQTVINDPFLKAQFEQMVRQQQAANPSATQPAALPGGTPATHSSLGPIGGLPPAAGTH
jgi:hypothetical protein